MIFEEAVENDYLIVVKNACVAKKLKKKYKNGRFKGINAGRCSFDGYSAFFIDVDLTFTNAAEHIQRIVPWNTFFGKVPELK